jgi:calcium-dependent protein kinase
MGDLRIQASDFINESNRKLSDTYIIGEVLGKGGFGIVKKITHKITREVRAVKILDKTQLASGTDLQNFLNEVAILKTLDHPNIAKLYEYFQDTKKYYLIFEICTGGELFDRVANAGSFSEAIAASYMKDILSVISYCHEKKVVHRDLKPENFLLDTNLDSAHLKAIDFGASMFFVEGEAITETTGTPQYQAPEVFDHKYNEKCDEWSAGIIMYILLCGYPPFYGKNKDEIIAKVKLGKFSFASEEWESISKDAKDLIKKLLNKRPKTRITASKALQHKWFKNANSVPLGSGIATKLFSNLSVFNSEMKLQKATYSFIASQLATKSEKEEIYKIFKAIDTDGNGTLSREELIKGFGEFYRGEVDDIEAEVDKIMEQIDIDKNGDISYTEFVSATMHRNILLSKDKLKAAFEMFDIDKSGTIEAEELKQILGKSENFNDQVWEDIIKEADQNGDGVIDFKEFCDMMLK